MSQVLCLCCRTNYHLPPPEGGIRCFPCTVHCEGAECELPLEYPDNLPHPED